MFIIKSISRTQYGLGNRAYIFGGASPAGTKYTTILGHNGVSRSIESSSLAEQCWFGMASGMGPAVFRFGGTATTGGSASSMRTERYDGTSLSNISGILGDVTYGASCTINNGIFMFGGYYNSAMTTPLTVIKSFNGTSSTTSTATLPSARARHSVTALDFNAYIFGGENPPNAYFSTILKFDSSAVSTATQASSLASNNSSSTACTFNRNCYIFGGSSSASGGIAANATTTIQKYTGSSISAESATLSTPLIDAAAASFTNGCFVYGGSSSGSVASSAIQKFNGSALTTDSATLPAVSFGHRAANIGYVL